MTTTILAALLVAALTIVYVAYPLIRRREVRGSYEATYDDELDQLLTAREGAYRAIRDLDFDYQASKLAEDDYRELRAKYTAQAVSIMQALDQRDQGTVDSALDAILEQKILEARRGAAQPASKATRAAPLTCPECGHERAPDDQFCARCGASLARLCPDCGTSAGEGDRFCARCGARLTPEAQRTPSEG